MTYDLGKMLKQRRVMIPLTLQELAHSAGVSASHLGRVERGNRFPSARILRRNAGPLGLTEGELFTFTGYLSPQASGEPERVGSGHLYPSVAALLSQEPVKIQRTVITILSILKSSALQVERDEHG